MNSPDLNIKKRNIIKSFFSDILEAVSGTEQDFTERRLSRAILLLSIPAVLEMIMESVFVIVDIYFVSKLGADAVATVVLFSEGGNGNLKRFSIGITV